MSFLARNPSIYIASLQGSSIPAAFSTCLVRGAGATEGCGHFKLGHHPAPLLPPPPVATPPGRIRDNTDIESIHKTFSLFEITSLLDQLWKKNLLLLNEWDSLQLLWSRLIWSPKTQNGCKTLVYTSRTNFGK